MKILICLYSINNYGGITTYVEELHRGFLALGHETDLMLLAETDRKPYNKRHSKRPGNFPSSWKGMSANPDTGWGGVPVWSYANLDRIKEFRSHARKYDLVIWGVPVPSWSKLHLVPNWASLYKMDVPQVAVIHDGNFRYLYPHLNHVARNLAGVACVHGAAYASAEMFDGNYSLIPNPYPLRSSSVEWEDKRKVIVSAHMWKGWKHMELAVGAARWLTRSKIVLGGDGIERRYMCSPTKCPPKYEGLWSSMEESGRGKYVNILTQKELRSLYERSRVMFDPSYSKNYNRMGSHFNRSVFEGYNSGVIPVCMEQNMNFPGLFKEGYTHVGIPEGSSTKKIARILEETVFMDAESAGDIVNRGRQLIKKHFHREVVAQGIINLAESKPCGLFKRVDTGETNKRMRAATQSVLSGERPKDRVL
jgi:glycosyltransferase involved in cell wall biosynthesis